MANKRIKQLTPPATIGIIGGGQLGKMMSHEAKKMGYDVVIYDPKENAIAAQVSNSQVVGGFSDEAKLLEFAKQVDVITYEFEHLDATVLENLENKGYPIYPSAATLRMIQDKNTQKKWLEDINVPVPANFPVYTYEQLEDAFNRFNSKIVVKTRKEGYDGKGNIIVKDIKDVKYAYEQFADFDIMVEEFIDFSMEVSVMLVKNEHETVIYPTSYNNHEDSILIKSQVPAKVSDHVALQIRQISQKVLDELQDYGIFCIEFFVTKDQRVLVNEIAPRPHNSGHYTIEGCVCSQFEQIIRVITGLPLGSSELINPSVMYNLLGEENGKYTVAGLDEVLKIPNCHFHLYGKDISGVQRKLGHLTIVANSLDQANILADQAFDKIKFEIKGEQ